MPAPRFDPTMGVLTLRVCAMPSTNSNTISDERGREIFDVLPGYEFGAIDIMGQGTWRVNAERINWAVFANAVRTLCGMCRCGAHGWRACGACGACGARGACGAYVWCVRVVRAAAVLRSMRGRSQLLRLTCACVRVCVCAHVHAAVSLSARSCLKRPASSHARQVKCMACFLATRASCASCA